MRAILASLSFAVATTGFAATAPPAAAATEPPWHFVKVTGQLTLGAGATGQTALQCPGGYTPVSGGFSRPSTNVWRAFDYPTAFNGTYEWAFINGDGVSRTMNLSAYCVLASDVGTVTSVFAEFPRDGFGVAYGTLNCPAGTGLLSGGVDWSGGGDRRVDQSMPRGKTGWYASGYSTIVGAKLAIEVRCITGSLLSSAVAVADHSGALPNGNQPTVSVSCPINTRVLTGGAGTYSFNPNADGIEPYTSASTSTNRGWTATADVAANRSLEATAICVPAQAPVASFTSTPPEFTNSSSATFSFTASDPLGEPLTYTCLLDNVGVSPCAPNTSLTYGPLSAGQHNFTFQALNQSGRAAGWGYGWTIDQVAPTTVTTSPTGEVLPDVPVSVQFSEVVQGVDATSFSVAPTAGGSPLTGTITTSVTSGKTTAAWQHETAPFVPGQWYTVTLTSGIHDVAGNALAPTSWQFRAVENVPPTVLTKAPTSSLPVTGPVTVTFSEVVTGASPSSMYVRADGTTTNIPGTVTTSVSGGRTTATWRPASPLTPGRWHTVYLTAAIEDQFDNALQATSWRVRAATTVQNDSPALVERWDVDRSGLASGGLLISSRTVGSAATLAFTATSGQAVSVYGLRLPSGGYAEVWLDGVKKATIHCYATTTARARLYLSGALGAGRHTLQVKVLGTRPAASSGTWIALDTVTVGATTYQETVLRQTFRRVGAAGASGGSYDVTDYVKDAEGRPSYSLKFWGTGIKLYATKSPTSGQAAVYVDGALVATVNLYAATTTYKNLVFAKALGTATAQHTIAVYLVGTASGARSSVALDCLLIT